MISTADPYARARASHYWDGCAGPLERLNSLLGDVQQAMLDLVEEYRATLPSTRLVLYAARDGRSGPPRALYWGHTISALRMAPDDPLGRRPKRYRHIPGKRLTAAHVRTYALKVRLRAVYFDFDRRRLARNEAHRSLKRAIDAIRKTLLARCPEEVRAASPVLFQDLLGQPSLPAAFSVLALPIARMLDPILMAELELRRLVEFHNAAPVDRRFVMFFDRDMDHPFGRVRWFRSAGWIPIRMTQSTLSRAGVPEEPRRRILDFETERRSIVRLRDPYTKVFTRLKVRAAAGLHAATAALDRAMPLTAAPWQLLPSDPPPADIPPDAGLHPPPSYGSDLEDEKGLTA